MTIKEKILAYLDAKGIKRGDFFESIGISPSNFKGSAKISELGADKIVKILSMYPDLSAEWLMADRGNMLLSDINIPQPTNTINIGIPLIPIDAMAGALSGDISVLEYECERYVIPAFKGADFLISVKGSSMYPKYNSGDIVACKCVPMSDLFFQWNKVYVIDTNQGALIKRIKKGEDPEHVLIVSENKDYEPFELPINSIYSVASVMGVIRLE